MNSTFIKRSFSSLIQLKGKQPYSDQVLSQTLRGIMEKLLAAKFVSIRKSFISCIQKIDIVEENMVRIG